MSSMSTRRACLPVEPSTERVEREYVERECVERERVEPPSSVSSLRRACRVFVEPKSRLL
jgi:hypothetical protein